MGLEFSISILATIITISSAIFSWLKVITKKRAEDSLIKILSNEVNAEQKTLWAKTINDIKEQNDLADMVKLNQKQVELFALRQKEIEEVQRELAALIEKVDKLNTQQKQLIFEGVKQPSQQGQIAYMEKIISKINESSVLEAKE